MIVIGVTGGFGTGKSTVAGMFEELGAFVLDADVIAHEVMKPRRVAWRKIQKIFGEGVLNEDETINSKHLAEIVFKDAQRRRLLEAIVHPHVLREIKQRLHRMRRSRKTRAAVVDAPLLLEAGARALVDKLVVVTAPPNVQEKRLKSKYGWTSETIRERSEAQLDLSAKAALADYVINNEDGVDSTRTQVKKIWRQLAVRHRQS